MRTSLATLMTAALLAGSAVQAAPKVGEAAPDFSLRGSDGKTYKLSDFRGGKPVVIAWFPKAFTGGCTAECKSLRENGSALKGLNVAVFAASVDDAETNRRFAESLELDYPILSDPTKAAAKAYGVLNEANGLAQRWTFYIGADGRVLFVDQGVQPSSHGAAVVSRLKELGIGR